VVRSSLWVVNGRLGRFRTADLLCVREALSH
jgi:hypothetical protein